jgi:hypothetical protein
MIQFVWCAYGSAHPLSWLALSLCYIHLVLVIGLSYLLSTTGEDNFLIKSELRMMSMLYSIHVFAISIFNFAPLDDSNPGMLPAPLFMISMNE